MNFLNSWLQGIVVAVVIATILGFLMPNGNNKKYVKTILGVYILFNIIAPVVNKYAGSDFELSSLINVDKYLKKMDTYNSTFANTDINKSNDENIKQIYKTNLASDIKAKLQEKKYFIKEVKVEIDDSENFNIEKIYIYLNNDNKGKIKENDKKIVVNEIEKVELQLGDKKVNEIESNITDNQKAD